MSTPLREIHILTFLSPTIGVVFSIVMYAIWTNHREREYVRLLAAAFLLYAVGSAMQLFGWPADHGHNALAAGACYLVSVAILLEGCLRRLGTRAGVGWLVGVPGLVLGLLYYFYYIHPDLQLRIYVLNFGCGALILLTAWRMRAVPTKKRIDHVLMWVFFAFGLQFFVRTLLTAGTAGIEYEERSFLVSAFWGSLHFSMVLFSVIIALTLLSCVVLDIIEDLRTDSRTDVLTGLNNRRGFDGRATQLMLRESKEPMSLVVCDIDHFKRINDGYGHAAGDAVLRGLATLMAGEVRRGDVVGRMGGEEFALLLPDSDLIGARVLADRLRSLIENARFDALPPDEPVTASFGIAQRLPAESLPALTARADRMLYLAKNGGRNRVFLDNVSGDERRMAHLRGE